MKITHKKPNLTELLSVPPGTPFVRQGLDEPYLAVDGEHSLFDEAHDRGNYGVVRLTDGNFETWDGHTLVEVKHEVEVIIP